MLSQEQYDYIPKVKIAGKSYDVEDILSVKWNAARDAEGYHEATILFIKTRDGQTWRVKKKSLDQESELFIYWLHFPS